jgi:CheY-like chemotaxis protein
MNPTLAIICVEDEPEVLDSIILDLEMYEEVFQLEAATSVNDALSIMKRLDENDIPIALFICDHLMPEKTGVDFLIEMNQNPMYESSSKMLLTGQAGLNDTVKALNEGGLDYYLAKPWDRVEFQQIVNKLLTDFVIKRVKNLLPFMSLLDAEKLSNSIRDKNSITDF